MRRMDKMIRWFLIAPVLLIVLFGCEQKEREYISPLRTVRYIEIESGSTSQSYVFNGVSRSEQEVALSFRIPGTLESLDVAVGDTVTSGQGVARIDASEYLLQAEQAEADLARVNAAQRNAESVWHRVRNLYENQVASRADLDNARATFESAAAQMEVARRTLGIARLNVENTRLAAGDSCAVVSTGAEVGENIAGGQKIIRLHCGGQIKINMQVSESLISSLEPDMPAVVLFDSLPDEEFNGSISEIGVAATGTTFPVSVRLNNPEGLRAGMAARISFSIENRDSRILVPGSSVIEDQKGRFVYLVIPTDSTNTGLIKRQPVQVGNLTDSGIEIISGVAIGDRVATAGVTKIRDGLEVRFH